MVTVLVPLAQGMEEPGAVSIIDAATARGKGVKGNVARLKPG